MREPLEVLIVDSHYDTDRAVLLPRHNKYFAQSASIAIDMARQTRYDIIIINAELDAVKDSGKIAVELSDIMQDESSTPANISIKTIAVIRTDSLNKSTPILAYSYTLDSKNTVWKEITSSGATLFFPSGKLFFHNNEVDLRKLAIQAFEEILPQILNRDYQR